MNPLSPASDPATFEPSGSGYIRNWLVAGPKLTPYAGPGGADHVMRRAAIDPATVAIPDPAVLGGPGPFGDPWQYHDPGHNEFVEFSTFYQELTVVEYFASTELECAESGERPALFWAAGAADLWLNGEHITRLNVTRYRNPDSRPVTLNLKRGTNRLFVRSQCLGIRDTRILFGLRFDNPVGITVRIPGADHIARAAQWIDTVRAQQGKGLESGFPAPFAAQVIPFGGESVVWPAGESSIAFTGIRPVSADVEVEIDGVKLHRIHEFPGNRPPVQACKGDRRTAHLAFVAKAGTGGESPASWNTTILPLLARRLLGIESDQDPAAFAAAIAVVDARRDCADFVLAALLRMQMLNLCTPEESAEVRRAALAFRFWMDEPGNDAMCFNSENHSLLFHGCQLLAGLLYPDEVFGNSGLAGREQAALALPRIRKWLEKAEARGFEEFNSGTYMPITIAAMLNVVDFSSDEKLSARMAAQIDRILRDLARHSFGGGVISPQGRVYRDVLTPEESGTQAILAFASDATDVELAGPRPKDGRGGDWVVFPASSPRYRPPADLAEKIASPVSRVYRHAEVQIALEKTPGYILTSLAVPAEPRAGEHPDLDLRPGGAGYQQHLWQATLGRDCHIFVNHPGGFFDGTKSRPGYWHGNGLLPRVRQQGNWLQAIHVIADGTKTKPPISMETWEWGTVASVRPYDLHPISFVHAHWPSDSFDREVRSGNWVFGQKGNGLIGLWCSEPLVPHDDILTGRELRANSYASAWLAVCGDLENDGSLEKFLAACAGRNPDFDKTKYILSMNDADPTRWWERPEPMPE